MQKAYHLVGLVFFLLEKKKSYLFIGITGKIHAKFSFQVKLSMMLNSNLRIY